LLQCVPINPICSAVGERPRIGVREIPDGMFSSWLVREVTPGTEIEVQTPTGSFRADPAVGGRHLCIAAGSGITPMLSIASSVLAHPTAESPCCTATGFGMALAERSRT
jgi:ring-1,2-phenylacetyl-CoA epoxidase subunit PaaE